MFTTDVATDDAANLLARRKDVRKKKIKSFVAPIYASRDHLAAKLTPHPQLPSLLGLFAIANELLIISST